MALLLPEVGEGSRQLPAGPGSVPRIENQPLRPFDLGGVRVGRDRPRLKTPLACRRPGKKSGFDPPILPLALKLYGLVLRIENRLLRWFDLPAGISLVAKARKKRGEAGGD